MGDIDKKMGRYYSFGPFLKSMFTTDMQDLKLFLGVFVSFAVVYYFLHRSTMSSMSKSLPGVQ